MSAFPQLPLEDFPEDIVAKAQRGLGLTDEELAAKAGLSADAVKAVLDGGKDEQALRALAAALQLDGESLVRQARGDYQPSEVQLEGLLMANTDFGDMAVNAFIVFDRETKEAAMFDTGATSDPLIAQAKDLGLKVRQILLTHTHADHVEDLDKVRQEFGVSEAMMGQGEDFSGATAFAPGREFAIGGLKVGTRLTWGHAKGGITFVVDGLEHPLAIVGDALFAGSMGGPKESYEACLETNRKEIFSLPDDTVIACGHGPLTTVAEEKANNPFFPEFK